MLRNCYLTKKTVIFLWMGVLSLLTTDAWAQDAAVRTPVTGSVRTESGQALIGASVLIKGTLQGATTDLGGNFRLNAAPQDVLVFSYVGYAKQEVSVDSNTVLNITMAEDNTELEEVVVTALGIKRQEKALSYSVQQIGADKFTTVKDANFMSSLVGKVAGVQLNSGASGPGSSVRVVMRGEKSIANNNSNALYVIDGVPMFNRSYGGSGGTYAGQTGSESIADLNPEDIESINLLTGASAAALYGSSAARGVVIINTKKGMNDRTAVTVSNNTTFSRVYMLPRMQNSYGTSSGLMNCGEKYDSPFNARDFFNTGADVINSVSLTTGNRRNQTYVSASTTNATGTIPENGYNRYNFTARNTASFAKDKLVLDVASSFIMQNDRNMVSQGKYYNPLPSLYLFPRSEDFNEIRLFERWNPVLGYMSQYWPYGEGAHSLQNPYWIQNRTTRESVKQRYMFNTSLKWNITDWMNVTGRVSVDNSEYRMVQKLYATTLTTFCDPNGGYEDQTQRDRNFYADVIVNFDKDFCGKLWTLHASIGTSISDQRFAQAGGAGNLNLIPNLFTMNNINYKNKYKPLHSGYTEENQGVFASLEAGYKSMLYLTLTGRNEWPSPLAFSKHASYYYPSAGLSALISNMVTLPKWVSLLKVRTSYSEVASPFNRFLSNPSHTFDSQSHGWTASVTHPARDLKPEATKSWETGLNARFFNGRLNLDATFYHSNTYNQTFMAELPPTSGYRNIIVQAGDVQNRGIELLLGFNNKWKNFSWASTYTYTFNENKIMRMAKGATNPYTGAPIFEDEVKKTWLGQENVAPLVILREGGTLGDIYVNHELKRDLNGNIAIDPSTGNLSIVETEFRKAGQLSPKFTMGWSNNFGYKGIDLGVVVAARVGGVVYSATQGVLDYYGISQATADARDNGGIPINWGKIDAQKYYSAISTAEGGHGAYYLYSATNLRLQEMSLNYTLPQKLTGDNVRLSMGLVARNLWIFYCKAPFDPEISPATGSAYYQGVDYFMQPNTRNIGFNVKLSF